MAKVFEALLQSREHSPDQTKKFLDYFDFGNSKSGASLEAVELAIADMPIPSGEKFDDEEIPTSFFDSAPVGTMIPEAEPEIVQEPPGEAASVESSEMPLPAELSSPVFTPVPEESPVSQELAPIYPLFPGLSGDITPPQALETEHFTSEPEAGTIQSETQVPESSEAELPLFATPAPEAFQAEPQSNFQETQDTPETPEAVAAVELPPVNPTWADSGDLAALNSDDQVEPAAVLVPAPAPVPQVEVASPVPHRVPGEFIKLSEIIHKAAETSPLKVLLVSSAEENESADFVTRNLCLALSETPTDKIGFLDLALPARRNRKIDDAVDFRIRIHKTPIANLREIIPDGGPVSVSGLFAECDVTQLFQTLRSRFDFLVIKAPSVSAVPEVKSLASMVDGVILSADKDSAHTGTLDEVKARLKASNARILGTLLNRHRDPRTNIAA